MCPHHPTSTSTCSCPKAGTLLLVSDNALDHLPAYALFKEVVHAQRGRLTLPGANAYNQLIQALADFLYSQPPSCPSWSVDALEQKYAGRTLHACFSSWL